MSAVALACAGCIGMSAATAQIAGQREAERTSDVTFKLGAGHSDNVFRRQTVEDSGSYTALGVLVDIARESTRLTATVNGDIEFRNYSTDGIKDEPYGDLSAEIEVAAVPDRFSWVFSDRYGQGRVDPFNAIGPANQEQVNVFATGPQLFLPVGDRNEIRLSTQAGRRTYGDSPSFDNDTLESSIGIFRQLGTTTEVGFNMASRDVEYDDVQRDNTIDRAYFTYRKTLASGQASLEVGANEVDFATTKQTNPFFNLGWNRDLTSRTNLAFRVQSAFVDAGDTFRGGTTFEDSLRTADVYERSSGEVAITFNPGRSTVVLGTRLGQDRYENETIFDNDMLELIVGLDRTISARLSVGFDLVSANRDFKAVDQKDDDMLATVWFERLFGPQLSLYVAYAHEQRGGQNAGGFDENTLRVMVQYGLNRRRPTP